MNKTDFPISYYNNSVIWHKVEKSPTKHNDLVLPVSEIAIYNLKLYGPSLVPKDAMLYNLTFYYCCLPDSFPVIKMLSSNNHIFA